MVKRSTWILLIILALVVGSYFLLKNHPFNAKSSTPTPSGSAYLITQADGVLQSLHISDSKGNDFKMQRDLSKAWVITAPSSGTADQGLAGAAETQVGALSIIAKLSSPPDPNTVGLVNPAYTINLTFVSGKSHTIEVGNLTLTSSGYYVRFDGDAIIVIEQSGIDALTKLLTAPPFPPTPTLSTPETTGTATLQAATPTP